MSFTTATWTSLHTHSCHQLHPQVSQNRDLNNFMMELCEAVAIRQMTIPIYLWQETTGFYMERSHSWGRLIRTKQSLFKRLIFPMDFSLIYHITTRFRTKSNENRHFSFILWKSLLQFEYWFLWCITWAAQCLCCKVSKTMRASSCTKFMMRKKLCRGMADIYFFSIFNILLYCVFDSNSIYSFLSCFIFLIVVTRLCIFLVSMILFIFTNKQMNDIIKNSNKYSKILTP